jgi:hypothetical protein
MGERKKITADFILDMYEQAKKSKGIKKEDLMKRVIFFSKILNERVDLEKITVK